VNLTRVQRLLKLLHLLQGSRGCNASALANQCGVSRRTIFRDLDTLRRAEVPLVYDAARNCYSIPNVYFLAPTNLNNEEALTVMVLCHELSAGGLPYCAPARSAASKLENSLPQRVRDQLQSLSGAVHVRLGPGRQIVEDDDVFRTLTDAIAQRQCVRLFYGSLTEKDTICTKVHPYKLLFSRHSWYVIGRSSLHRSVRTFHLGRIESLEVLEDHFELPKGFRLGRYLKNAWNLIPDGPDEEVTIRFSEMVAQNVAGIQWHKTQRIKHNDGGTIDFSATVSGLTEISWWIMGYGDQAEVLEPPRLREMIAERARRTAAVYDE